MIKISIFILGLLLLMAGWFIFIKAKEAFILQPETYEEKELQHLHHFFRIYGGAYIFLGFLCFLCIFFDSKLVYAGLLVIISLFTASFSLRLSKKLKTK